MKIWRYNACFCCLNCLLAAAGSPPLMARVSGYSNPCKTPHTAQSPTAGCCLTQINTNWEHSIQPFLQFRDKSKISLKFKCINMFYGLCWLFI